MASSRTTSSRSARSQHDHSPRGGVNQPTRTNRTNRGSLSPPRTLFQVLVARAWPWAFTAGERGSCVVSAKGAPWSQLRASGRQYAASLVDANVNQIGDTRQVEGRGRGAST